jgi:putative membrane protein
MKLLTRWLIIVIALVVAVQLVPGIYVEGTGWVAFAVMALVLGFVNAFIRPVLKFLSCGCIILTMGLFMLVINAFTLWVSAWISQEILDIGFVVDGFWPALFGGIVVSIVSFLLSLFLIDEDDR